MFVDSLKPNYTREEAVFEDGEWWYIQPGDGKRRRITSHARKNTTRMFVNGKYVPKSDPLHKPGNWKTWTHVHSLEKLESTDSGVAGYVYVIVNEAWPEWVKIGCAKDADDRLNSYQTYSPFRDYSIVARIKTDNRHMEEKEMHKAFTHFAKERKNEWFKIDRLTAIKIFNYKLKEKEDAA
tara:strand:- start:224 stop:766 length:543 start_codon:yes stop_codon:yes gene_type:complete